MPWKWRKLVNNVVNAFDALMGDAPESKALVDRARTEAIEVLQRAGIEMTPESIEQASRAGRPSITPIPGLPYGGSSSRQSLARSAGSIESAYFNGEIARVAHRLGYSAPLNEGVVGIAERAAREGRLPGSFSVAELSRELGID